MHLSTTAAIGLGAAALFVVGVATGAAPGRMPYLPPDPGGFQWGKWTATDFRSLSAMSQRLKMQAADLLAVLMNESNGDPSATNPSGHGDAQPVAVGLNQLTKASNADTGLTEPQRWAVQNLSVAQQLPIVERYFAALPYTKAGRTYTDAGIIYAANFAPNRIGDGSDGVVLYTKGKDGAAYAQNASLDRANKGTITIGDMRAAIRSRVARSDYKAARAALQKWAGV